MGRRWRPRAGTRPAPQHRSSPTVILSSAFCFKAALDLKDSGSDLHMKNREAEQSVSGSASCRSGLGLESAHGGEGRLYFRELN